MKCINHLDVEATAICSRCSNPLCQECSVKVEDKTYCKSCVSKALKDSTKKKGRSVKLTIGSILCIVIGVFGVIVGLLLILTASEGAYGPWGSYTTSINLAQIVLGIACIVIGVGSFIGACFALTRKSFGMALAGAICAILLVFLVGILTFILIALSKDDFDAPQEKPIEPEMDEYKQYKHDNVLSRDPFDRGGGSGMFKY